MTMAACYSSYGLPTVGSQGISQYHPHPQSQSYTPSTMSTIHQSARLTAASVAALSAVQPTQPNQSVTQPTVQQQPKDYSIPLHVDCSVEYELPNQAKPPAGARIEPLLMIHPCYFRKMESQRRSPFINNMPNSTKSGTVPKSGQNTTNIVSSSNPCPTSVATSSVRKTTVRHSNTNITQPVAGCLPGRTCGGSNNSMQSQQQQPLQPPQQQQQQQQRPTDQMHHQLAQHMQQQQMSQMSQQAHYPIGSGVGGGSASIIQKPQQPQSAIAYVDRANDSRHHSDGCNKNSLINQNRSGWDQSGTMDVNGGSINIGQTMYSKSINKRDMTTGCPVYNIDNKLSNNNTNNINNSNNSKTTGNIRHSAANIPFTDAIRQCPTVHWDTEPNAMAAIPTRGDYQTGPDQMPPDKYHAMSNRYTTAATPQSSTHHQPPPPTYTNQSSQRIVGNGSNGTGTAAIASSKYRQYIRSNRLHPYIMTGGTVAATFPQLTTSAFHHHQQQMQQVSCYNV